jgi:hypothetical protein
MRFNRVTMFCALAVCLCGCNAGTRYPQLDPYNNVAPPGTVVPPNARNRTWLQQAEQRQAVQFDPYPDDDIGPKVDGGRPPGYGQQLPEAVRSRWVRPGP